MPTAILLLLAAAGAIFLVKCIVERYRPPRHLPNGYRITPRNLHMTYASLAVYAPDDKQIADIFLSTRGHEGAARAATAAAWSHYRASQRYPEIYDN